MKENIGYGLHRMLQHAPQHTLQHMLQQFVTFVHSLKNLLRNLLACLFSLSAQSLFDSHVHLDKTSSRLGLPPTTSLYHLVTYDPNIPWDTFAGCVANRVAFW